MCAHLCVHLCVRMCVHECVCTRVCQSNMCACGCAHIIAHGRVPACTCLICVNACYASFYHRIYKFYVIANIKHSLNNKKKYNSIAQKFTALDLRNTIFLKLDS